MSMGNGFWYQESRAGGYSDWPGSSQGSSLGWVLTGALTTERELVLVQRNESIKDLKGVMHGRAAQYLVVYVLTT